MGKRGRHRQSSNDYNSSPIKGGDYHEQEQDQYTGRTETKIVLQAKTQGQKQYIQAIVNNDIVLCQGPAGSGKTACAIGIALQSILGRNPQFDKLLVVRSVRESNEESLGYLPGSIDEKMLCWLMPVVDNLKLFVPEGTINYLIRKKKIEALPLAYIRGRSLNDAFILVDEAQNCTPKQILTVLTRLGENSKLVIEGDISQSDLQTNQQSGLEDAIDRLNSMEGVGVVQLDESDIVRNPMIGEIIRRYQN